MEFDGAHAYSLSRAFTKAFDIDGWNWMQWFEIRTLGRDMAVCTRVKDEWGYREARHWFMIGGVGNRFNRYLGKVHRGQSLRPVNGDVGHFVDTEVGLEFE
jgi:hypothetical protein